MIQLQGISVGNPEPETGWWTEGDEGENLVGVGWLHFTTYAEPGAESDLVQRLEDHLGAAEARVVPVRYFTASWSVLEASTISTTTKRPGDVNIDLTQTDCERLGLVGLHKLLHWLNRQSLKPLQFSRFDLNYDDYAMHATPEYVAECVVARDTVTHVEKAEYVKNLDVQGRDDFQQGGTLYVGTRKSYELLRVYNGQAKHGGDRPFTRWEMQYMRKSAQDRAERFFLLRDDVPKLSRVELVDFYWSTVRRLIDFRERASAFHPEDRKPLTWWEALTALPAKLRLPRQIVVPASFERSARFMRNYLSTTIARVVDEAERSGHGGWAFVQLVAEEGRDKLLYRQQVAATGYLGVG